MRLAIMVATLLASTGLAMAQGTGAFDGNWQGTVECPIGFDGAYAYTLRFAATVTNGVYRSEYGVRGEPGYLALDGTIAPNGDAMLRGQGLTAETEYAVGHPKTGTPYSYHVRSHFSGNSGTGVRVENRPCVSRFTKE